MNACWESDHTLLT